MIWGDRISTCEYDVGLMWDMRGLVRVAMMWVNVCSVWWHRNHLTDSQLTNPYTPHHTNRWPLMATTRHSQYHNTDSLPWVSTILIGIEIWGGKGGFKGVKGVGRSPAPHTDLTRQYETQTIVHAWGDKISYLCSLPKLAPVLPPSSPIPALTPHPSPSVPDTPYPFAITYNTPVSRLCYKHRSNSMVTATIISVWPWQQQWATMTGNVIVPTCHYDVMDFAFLLSGATAPLSKEPVLSRDHY